jgi:hypothetical protein
MTPDPRSKYLLVSAGVQSSLLLGVELAEEARDIDPPSTPGEVRRCSYSELHPLLRRLGPVLDFPKSVSMGLSRNGDARSSTGMKRWWKSFRLAARSTTMGDVGVVR